MHFSKASKTDFPTSSEHSVVVSHDVRARRKKLGLNDLDKPRAGPNFLIFVFDPKNAVECPLETSAKDDLARRLSPHSFVPIENLTFTSP